MTKTFFGNLKDWIILAWRYNRFRKRKLINKFFAERMEKK